MKIAILNFSGNVGKTTVARDIFSYRLPDYSLISIESVNDDGKEKILIRGEEGDKLLTEIILNDNLILDIGSSNLEAFFRSSTKEAELLDSIDKFIVPVTPEQKQQADTVKTLKYLVKQGVRESSIHVIFNQVIDDHMSNPKDIFKLILGGAKAISVNANLDNLIFKHDLYNLGETLSEMINDEDYRMQMEEAKASGEKELARQFAQKYVRQKKIKKLNQTYQNIFDAVMGE